MFIEIQSEKLSDLLLCTMKRMILIPGVIAVFSFVWLISISGLFTWVIFSKLLMIVAIKQIIYTISLRSLLLFEHSSHVTI